MDILNHNNRLRVIAGPCSAESFDQLLRTATALKPHIDIFRAGIWKPRTRPGGFEGYGEKALRWLIDVKKELGIPVATEIGTCRQAESALRAGVDLLWIGARTTCSPFAVQEIAETLRGTDTPVLVKNPSCADLSLWIGAIERLQMMDIPNLGLIHRGFKSEDTRGYRNLPMWSLTEEIRKEFPDIPVYCDPSHMGGKRSLIKPLSRQAVGLGYDGLMIESHIDPDTALTDSFQQVTPSDLNRILSELSVGCQPTAKSLQSVMLF